MLDARSPHQTLTFEVILHAYPQDEVSFRQPCRDRKRVDSILACEQELNLTRTTATWRYKKWTNNNVIGAFAGIPIGESGAGTGKSELGFSDPQGQAAGLVLV